MIVSWMPPDVSSRRVRIGRRWLVSHRGRLPTAGMILRICGRVLHRHELGQIVGAEGPGVDHLVADARCWDHLYRPWPCRTWAALPRRAGMVTRTVMARLRLAGAPLSPSRAARASAAAAGCMPGPRRAPLLTAVRNHLDEYHDRNGST